MEIINCDRPGIFARWPKYKNLIKRKILGQESFDFMKNTITEYITRVDESTEMEVPNKINITNSEAVALGYYRSEDTLAFAPDNPRWLHDLCHWSNYYRVGAGSEFFWHRQFRIIFPDHPHGGLFLISILQKTEMLGVMALLGWRQATVYQGYLAHAALNRNYKLALEYEEEHRRGQAFMLRLFSDWVGDVDHDWPAYAYDEPIYETLLKYWRTPDPQALVPCLLAACDRHTHQSLPDTSRTFYDFGNLGWVRTPLEILFLFRLREWEGLSNPVLDHPLMAAPFDQLPPEQPVPPLDDMMQAVLKRAREDWPQYDQVLSLDALKE